RERQERERRQRQLLQPPAPATPPPAQSEDTACRRVKGLRLHGNRLLSDKPLQQVAEPHLAPCMDARAINRLLGALTAAYVQAGYITARPYILPQPADDGALQVALLEGQVEALEITDPALPLSLENAFGEMIGQPLHLPTLERGLDQLNRLRVFDLAGDIRPGQQAGGSRVVLRPLSYPPRSWATLQVTNDGADPAARERLTAHYQRESPLGWNDRVVLGWGHSVARGRRFYRNAALHYQVPRGPWQLTVGLSGYRYRSDIERLRQRRSAAGGGGLKAMSLARELYRSQRAIVTATARLNHKHIDTYIGGRRLPLQSPRYGSADLELDLLWAGAANFNAQLRYSEGFGGWNAADGHPAP
ncbi:ShlB/FhaC/HecB family hemolysin secretion/activation protein, partial [Pseudomonas typographi]